MAVKHIAILSREEKADAHLPPFLWWHIPRKTAFDSVVIRALRLEMKQSKKVAG
jgi:hypothetical protein